jgi:hypothetical protein
MQKKPSSFNENRSQFMGQKITEYIMSPDRSEIKYSNVMNLNTIIRENLSFMSHIRSSKDLTELIKKKPSDGLKNQIKIIQNNLENNDPFNKTPEGDIVNITAYTSNIRSSMSSSVRPKSGKVGPEKKEKSNFLEET